MGNFPGPFSFPQLTSGWSFAFRTGTWSSVLRVEAAVAGWRVGGGHYGRATMVDDGADGRGVGDLGLRLEAVESCADEFELLRAGVSHFLSDGLLRGLATAAVWAMRSWENQRFAGGRDRLPAIEFAAERLAATR